MSPQTPKTKTVRIPVENIHLEREAILLWLRENTRLSDAQHIAFLKSWEAGERGSRQLARAVPCTPPTIHKIKKGLLELYDPNLYEKTTGNLSKKTAQAVLKAAGPAPPVDPREPLSQEETKELLDRMIRDAENNGSSREMAELIRVRASITPRWREVDSSEEMDVAKLLGPDGLTKMGIRLIENIERLAIHRERLPHVWSELTRIVLDNPLAPLPTASGELSPTTSLSSDD